MPLPILTSRPAPSPADLVRLFHRCEAHWAAQTGEETTLDVGVAISNPALSEVWDANQIYDALLPEGISPAEAVAQVDDHFKAQGVRCLQWILNPSAKAAQTQPLAEHLVGLGWRRQGYEIHHLAGQPSQPITEVGGLTIIPARASFKHARQLAEESAAGWITPQMADAVMLHLEDPATDARLALKDGVAAGYVTVLAVGELGCIEGLFVSEKFRGQGIARTLMSRAIEICARSLFKHVFVGVERENVSATKLYDRFGFKKVGDFHQLIAPWTPRDTSSAPVESQSRPG